MMETTNSTLDSINLKEVITTACDSVSRGQNVIKTDCVAYLKEVKLYPGNSLGLKWENDEGESIWDFRNTNGSTQEKLLNQVTRTLNLIVKLGGEIHPSEITMTTDGLVSYWENKFKALIRTGIYLEIGIDKYNGYNKISRYRKVVEAMGDVATEQEAVEDDSLPF